MGLGEWAAHCSSACSFRWYRAGASDCASGSTHAPSDVREVMRNFVPVFISRGVVQISAFVDAHARQPAAHRRGYRPRQRADCYTRCQSACSEWRYRRRNCPPCRARSASDAEVAGVPAAAPERGPAADRLLHRAFRHGISGARRRGGGRDLSNRENSGPADARYVWGIVAGSAVGLLASTLGRLYSSTYYALRDTRTPLRFAVIRVALTTVLGYLCALPLPRRPRHHPRWGVAGLTASAGVAGWVEFTLLRRTLNARIGTTGCPPRLWHASGRPQRQRRRPPGRPGSSIGHHRPIVVAVPVLGVYGIVYFGAAYLLRVEECVGTLERVARFASIGTRRTS